MGEHTSRERRVKDELLASKPPLRTRRVSWNRRRDQQLCEQLVQHCQLVQEAAPRRCRSLSGAGVLEHALNPP
jgi:hypothetical protein